MPASNASKSTVGLSLPTGGGAIRGIGETFQPNLFTGTGTFTVPIATPPSRNDFEPKLSLRYSTGAGNDIFGLGWSVSIPNISRKTEKGIPRYASDDVFLISEAEDLVPQSGSRTSSVYTIQRYRPRTEGLFARIERWDERNPDGTLKDSHWRVISSDNVTSIYGRTPQARVADPSNPAHIYQWLLEETSDARGNHIAYEYDFDPASCQRYPLRVYYGNLAQNLTYANGSPVGAAYAGRRYTFEVVFDYVPGGRQDPFSSHRAGFEIRTLRACQSVRIFHHFIELGERTLVRSTDFDYVFDPETLITFLAGVRLTGYVREGTALKSAAAPPLQFEYSKFTPQTQRYQSLTARGDVLPERSLNTPDFSIVDLFGDGLPDVLHSSAQGFRYWKNLGNGQLDRPRIIPEIPMGLSLSQRGVSLMDMDGDGCVELIVRAGPIHGSFESAPNGVWNTFRQSAASDDVDVANPNARFLDLTGDGRLDLLITQDDQFVWRESMGENGFGSPQIIPRIHDLDAFPDVSFNDPDSRVRLADMSGDGLNDIVLLQGARVDYWPNLGYGRFGKRIATELPDAPALDFTFEPKRLFLVDLDGSGCADIVYVDYDRVHFWFNRSGGGWSPRRTISGTPLTTDLDSIQFADIYGTGTTSLVWSFDAMFQPGGNYKALDFCGGVKPYLLTAMHNNLGATTRVHYAASTKFTLEDQAAGLSSPTRLPFPVHVVEKLEVLDHIGRTRLVSTFKYHHGYFDGREREFRGFGRVDRFDAERSEDTAYQAPPIETRTWFHTGAYQDLTREFRGEFYSGDTDALQLAPHQVNAGDSPLDAYRALRGAILRTEVYGRDGSDRQEAPYLVTEQRYRIQETQPANGRHPAVYLSSPMESWSAHYERNSGDPRIGHTLTLEVDAFGNVLKSMAIAYGRRNPDPNLPLQSDIDAQTQPRITATENTYTNGIDDPVIDPDNYRTPSPSETRTYELTGFAPAGNARYFAFAPLPAAAEIPYEAVPDFITTQKRLIQHTRTVYRKNDLTGLLSLHKLESMALPGDVYTMAFTPGLLSGIFGARVSDAMLANDGGYVHTPGDPNWWIPSGQTFYSRGPTDSAAQELAFAQQHFFLPHRFRNALGHDAFMHYDNYSLFIVQTADSAGNKTGAAYDYRALKVARLIDPNGNVTEAVFDMLGMPAGTAGPGDTLNGFAPDPSVADISAFYDLADPHAAAAGLLNGATTRIIYDLERFRRTRDAYPLDPTKWEPVFAATLARETHAAAPLPPQGLRIQIRFSYSDGFGREIQHKAQAEPGTSPGVRWVGSGWTIFNNKGKPIQKFQPFFDDTHKFRFGRKAGVSKTLFYDAPERIVATLHPNHSYEKTVFDPWRQANYDVNDTIKLDPGTDDDVKGFFLIPLTQYLPTWYGQRAGNPAGDLNRAAAEKTLPHADTPEVAHLDALGRPFITFGDDGAHRFATRIDRNIQGHETVFRDERLKSDGSLEQRIVMRYGYDMRGSRIYQNSMDAGERWTLHDVTGKPIYLWNSLGCAFRTQYDSLGRPLRIFVTGADPLQPAQEFLTERFIYGEQHPGATARNLRGKLYLHLDQAGAVINDRYDSKGNLLRILRRLAGEYKQAIGWNAADAAVPANPTTAFDPVVLEAAVAPLLEQETFTGSTAYDALNRPIQLIAPYSNRAGAAAPPVALNVIQPVYNEANLLQRVDVWLEQSAEPAGLLDAALTPASPAGVTNIDYDARGQRTLVAYKNGAVTEWEYDLQTFRLTRLHTRRGTALTSDRLQDLRYTYDPRGNVTHIHDAAQQTIYFNNQQVDPDNDYTYDAMYRLIQASGREHIGQAGGAPSPHSHNDAARTGLPHPGDGDAMARYCENYVYDAIGNILEMSHRRTCPGIPAWTRTYAYNGNRLSSSKVGSSNNAVTDQFGHDAHGNLTTLPHLSGMRWNFKDQLRWTDMGGGGAAWYVYDSAGQRIRKVWEKSAGLIEERIYLGGVELFRRRQGAARFERETLRVAIGHDGKEAMALVETRTQDTAATDTAPRQLTRYQIGNAVGSACIELDRFAQIISYEEYTPYGSTSYQAVRSTTETPKRYRCSGKERDEESGLCYYGARYYAPWLAQWCSCDPDPEMNDLNAYLFMRNNPGFYLDADGRFPVAKGAVDAVRNLGGRKNYSQGTHQSMTIEAYNRSSFRSTEFRKGLVKGVESIDMPEGAVTALGKLIFEGKVLPHQFHDDKTIRDATSPDSKTLESHYGSPHWHSMSATGSTADQTRAAIVDQLEQWYDASEKAKTVSERGEYLGKIAHTLQDSWSKSHVERDASGKILGFQNYDLQDPDVHGSTEHVPQNDPSAVNVTAEMLEAAYAHDKDAFMRVINTNYSMAEGAKADYTAITPIKRNLGDRMRESTDIKDPRFQGIEIDP